MWITETKDFLANTGAVGASLHNSSVASDAGSDAAPHSVCEPHLGGRDLSHGATGKRHRVPAGRSLFGVRNILSNGVPTIEWFGFVLEEQVFTRHLRKVSLLCYAG